VEYGILSKVPLFSSLTAEEINILGEISTKKKFGREEIVIMQGEEGGSFFLILSGQVKVVIDSPQGREVTLAILGHDDFFGEMSLVDGAARSATVITLASTEALMISVRDFHNYLKKYPEVSIKLMKIFIDRLRHAARQIEHLALHSVKGRLARMILDWVVDFGTIRPDGVHFELPFAHKEIAGMLGTSRESVTRMLAELKDEGYIALDKTRVLISNLQGLREMLL
jgi:CRP/FNR family transcriptional regulator, cyclic AMP receptor protein